MKKAKIFYLLRNENECIMSETKLDGYEVVTHVSYLSAENYDYPYWV